MRADGSSDLMQWDAGIPGKEGVSLLTEFKHVF